MDQQPVRRLAPIDVLLPLLVGGASLGEAFLVEVPGWPAAVAVDAAACAVLVVRRWWPLAAAPVAVLMVSTTSWVGSDAFDELAAGLLVWAVALYALGRWAAERPGVVAFVATYAGVVVLALRSSDLPDLLWGLALFLPPYVTGRLVRRLADHAALLERQQALVTQEAVRAERDRVAHELHDVIAHSISAMVVQVAAGQDLVLRDPERAREVLGTVADTGRRAIEESDRLVHVIGEADATTGLAPTSGLRDLPALVEDFRAQGLAVELRTGPLPTGVPAAVDVSSYRIVREALTNALRYAADRSVRLEVRGSPDRLTIRAVNRTDGRGGAGSGLGLVGLRERVDLLRGELRHGVTRTGDFELVATLPVAPPEEP